ncbi:hypothetical protein [Haloglycomyces albus]|uniref:hypothetical protein n=1 Tax=Haloglycomyces albus TaxID=526067 RepID=UPI00046D8B83|nr:hypothetical protein [Haloglycomyces albus]
MRRTRDHPPQCSVKPTIDAGHGRSVRSRVAVADVPPRGRRKGRDRRYGVPALVTYLALIERVELQALADPIGQSIDHGYPIHGSLNDAEKTVGSGIRFIGHR